MLTAVNEYLQFYFNFLSLVGARSRQDEARSHWSRTFCDVAYTERQIYSRTVRMNNIYYYFFFTDLATSFGNLGSILTVLWD